MLSITLSPPEESESRRCTKRTSCTLILTGFDGLNTNFGRKMSDGMFLSACREVAKEFPSITYDEDLLDRVCLRASVVDY